MLRNISRENEGIEMNLGLIPPPTFYWRATGMSCTVLWNTNKVIFFIGHLVEFISGQ